MIKQVLLNGNSKSYVVDIWVFAVKFIQYCYIFEHFYNKILCMHTYVNECMLAYA